MTDPIPAEQTPQPEETGKGKGCFLGGLATVGGLIGGTIFAAALVSVLPLEAGAGTTIVGFVLAFLPIGLVVAAGIYWRRKPGFLLGIGLTIGIGLALFTGCVAIIAANA